MISQLQRNFIQIFDLVHFEYEGNIYISEFDGISVEANEFQATISKNELSYIIDSIYAQVEQPYQV